MLLHSNWMDSSTVSARKDDALLVDSNANSAIIYAKFYILYLISYIKMFLNQQFVVIRMQMNNILDVFSVFMLDALTDITNALSNH